MPEPTTPTPKPKGRKTNGVIRGSNIPPYNPDFTLSLAHRTAHYLDWAAEHRSFEALTWNEVTKAVMGFGHGVRDDNPNLELVRKNGSRVKKILNDKYNRGYINIIHHGIRASVDDNDRAIHCVPPAQRRLLGAVNNFKEQTTAINVNNVTDPTAKKLMQGNVRQLNAMFDDAMLKRLAPPAPTETP